MCSTSMLVSCESFFEPDYNNYLSDDTLNDPFRAEGLLIKAYIYLPSALEDSDMSTDNAVSNVTWLNYSQVATGSLSASYNPFGSWGNYYAAIQYANLFLDVVDNVVWDADEPEKNEMYKERLKGEAYGLRAYYQIELLKRYAGYDEAGNLLGYPIVTGGFQGDEWQDVGRSSYADCVNAILADLDLAIEKLPNEYVDGDDTTLNDVYGVEMANRVNGNIVRMLKSRMLLTAASPAFSDDSGVEWEDAANAAAELFANLGGLDNMTEDRTTFYHYNGVTNLDPDFLWRRIELTNATIESTNYPNSLYGSGRINPTHNLVCAFPAKNGYPITDPKSNFDPNDPYTDRDPRLSAYVVCNGATLGKNSSVIYTTADNEVDGINSVPSKTTRSGYYLRKFLNETAVQLSPTTVTAGHVFAIMRCTELYLIYAEAANEAWGPQVDGAGKGYSAYDVVKRMRKTAGIDEDDQYLESIKGDKDAMRELIRNERRIELCFEGARFWDIRRWKDLDLLKETPKRTLDGGLTQDATEIEARAYEDYMIYLPLPYDEVKKGLVQNKSW